MSEGSDLKNDKTKEQLKTIIELLEKMQNDEAQQIKNDIRELQDYKLKSESMSAARTGVINWIVRYWPGVLALLFAAYELKKMKP